MNLPATENHAPVTVSLLASALASVVIAYAKSKYGIDFAGQEANLQVLAAGAGYFLVNKKLPEAA